MIRRVHKASVLYARGVNNTMLNVVIKKVILQVDREQNIDLS